MRFRLKTKYGSAIVGSGHPVKNERYTILSLWWRWLRDPGFRQAVKTKRRIDKGELTGHTIATLSDGTEVKVPETGLVSWHSMPEEAKQAFLQTIENEKKEGGL